MAEYTQASRPMRVETELGGDVLLLAGLRGAESVSDPFVFELDLLSEDASVDAEKLLRTPMVVTIQLADGSERPIHGLVRRFFQLAQRDALTSYRAEVVPWLWFLSLSQDCKVFQQLNVMEIVEEVFKSQGYSDFQIRCNRTYPKRDYCVQYRESHLNFVSRLMEEEGIYYFFEHTDSKHTLILTDNLSSVQPCPGPSPVRITTDPEPEEEDVVTELHQEHSAFVGKVTLKDYDPLQPQLKLESTIAGEGKEEVYDYHPGRFTTLDEGERYARLQLETAEALRRTVRGSGNCRAFQAGCTFALTDHYRSDMNRKYALLSVTHVASTGDYRAWDSAPLDYQNQFLAIPDDVAYRPQQRHARPLVRAQTAMVVGPAGEEVYTDSHGRVKVQFYWDRLGKQNDKSSCWVRVATPWGGKGYGGVTIPRIGNEVLVEFLEGDPDRPLIVASVYNADQTPPFALPDGGIQMGMKSRSSPGGGGYNEITMTDTKGKEAITIHGQYDMATVVEHDQTTTVHNDRTETVDNNETITIGNDRTENVGNNETIQIAGSRSETVSKNESITVTMTRSRTVGVNDSITVGAAQEITVGGAQEITVGALQSTTVGADQRNKVLGNRSSQVGRDETVKVGKKLVIDAGDEIAIRTGSASIVMKKDGTITIRGKDIKIEGSGKIDVKASKAITMKGQKILQN